MAGVYSSWFSSSCAENVIIYNIRVYCSPPSHKTNKGWLSFWGNIDLEQYEQYIQNGEIDFLVMITQDFKDSNEAHLPNGIVIINHHDLPKLHSMLKSLSTIK